MALLEEFPALPLEAWHAEVLRLLKGKPYEKVMLTGLPEGITLRPLYTGADTAALPDLGSLPGQAPYLRGARAAGGWAVAQELPFSDVARMNEELQRALARGQSAVHLTPDEAARAGLDPDRAAAAQVGRGGTSLATAMDVSRALEGFEPAGTPLLLQAGAAPLPLTALLVAALADRGHDAARLHGCLFVDPAAELARRGALPGSAGALYDQVAWLTLWAERSAPRLHTAAALGHLYHDGGATAVQELGWTMAAALEHLRRAEQRGLAPERLAPRLSFGFSIGTRFFVEIAKLRAARLLWARICAACGAPDAAGGLWIHARTSAVSQTALDPHVNILRATTEALSAIAGGCDSLHVAPFDEALGAPGDLALRLARNTQIVLREEAHLGDVIDPAGGSWFVESLTEELAEKGWAELQAIERAGGLLAALAAGLPQRAAAEQARQQRERIARREQVLVGVNQYPNAADRMPAAEGEDLHIFQARRGAGFARARADRPRPTLVAESLRGCGDGEIVERLAAAATAGATLGELAAALAERSAAAGRSAAPVAGAEPLAEPGAEPGAEPLAEPGAKLGAKLGAVTTPAAVDPIPALRGAAAFETLRAAVQSWRAAGAHDPQVFLACIGPVGEYMPRLDFTRSFFHLAGFTVAAGDGFADAAAAAAAARASAAPIVVAVAPDAVYPAAVPVLAAELKAGAAPPRLIVAGYPREQVDALRSAGVDEFIHLKSDAHAVLADLARSVGATGSEVTR